MDLRVKKLIEETRFNESAKSTSEREARREQREFPSRFKASQVEKIRFENLAIDDVLLMVYAMQNEPGFPQESRYGITTKGEIFVEYQGKRFNQPIEEFGTYRKGEDGVFYPTT